MPRTAAASGITIGVIGTGPIEYETMSNLLIEYLSEAPEGPIHFVIPVGEDYSSDSTLSLIDFVAKNADDAGMSYTAVTKSGEKLPNALKPAVTGAATSVQVEDPGLQVLKLLEKVPHSAVLAFLGDTEYGDEEAFRVVNTALSAGISTYEITDQMALLQPAEEEATESTEEGGIYSRADLEAMAPADLRAFAKTLLETVPRATSAVVEAVLEAQGGYTEEEAPEDGEAGFGAPNLEAVAALLDDFSSRLMEILGGSVVEEEPVAEPEPVEAPVAAEPVKRGPGRPRKTATPEPEATPKRRFGK